VTESRIRTTNATVDGRDRSPRKIVDGAEVAVILDWHFGRPDASPSELADVFHDVHVPSSGASRANGLAVRWYLRFGLSYRDVAELLAERGVQVDHVTVYRWVQRFTPILADAARWCRHAAGSRWHVDETYVKVAGSWRYVYRAVDEYGQVIDVYVSARRDATAARAFFDRALATAVVAPVEVVTDHAAAYVGVLEQTLPEAGHRTEQYANNRIEADHGQLKRRLRPMRGLKTDGRRQDRDRRARLCPEHPPRTLRARRRCSTEAAGHGRVRRTGPGDLTSDRSSGSA
jgi:transposase-like protein